jgi:hypothetical protein
MGGLFDDRGDFINTGLPVELTERLRRASSYSQKRRIGKTWVLNEDPAIYADVITDWIQATPDIEVHCGASVADLTIESGRVKQIRAVFNGSTNTICPNELVDTTGNASIVRQVDEDLVADGVALGGFILQVRGLAHDAMVFPKGVALARQIRKAVENEELPPECSTVWLDTGVYPDEAYLKFSVPPRYSDAGRMRPVSLKLLGFLQKSPGFDGAFIHRYGEIGTRDGGRIKGEYCLTEQDIKEGKRFTDVACRACWPIEHWHPQNGISLEYLSPGRDYDIPLRSLKVSGFTNLWAAGKCLSADPRAQASARMAGTCWAMGEALGRHITGCVK